MLKLGVVVTVLVVAAGCSKTPSAEFSKLTEEFVNTTLSFSPASATAAGFHQYRDQKLDDLLDDFSPANLDKQRRFYDSFQQRLASLNSKELTLEEQADLSVMQDQTALAQMELKEIHTPQSNPTLYVETLGNALFSPFVLEYAPKPARIRSIIARLKKVPLFLDQASSNLTDAPPIWTR